MPDTYPPARRFSELRPTGLLWLINRAALHPHGVALALHADGDGDVYGWSLLRSPDGGPWTYPEDTDAAQYRAAQATLAAARAEDPADTGTVRCASCKTRAATYLNFADQPLCCTCAQCDCGQIPCRRLDLRLTCRAHIIRDRHGLTRCHHPAGHYRPGRRHDGITDTGERVTWLDGEPGAVTHEDTDTDDLGRIAAVRAVRPGPDGRPPELADGTLAPSRPPAVTSTDGSRPGEDGTPADGSGRAVRDRRTEVRQAIEGAFLADAPSGIRSLLEHVGIDTADRCITVAGRCVDPAPPGLLDGPARCSCGLTGELLAVDPAGAHAHAAPPAEERHPAVTAWGQCFDRAQAAEDQLAAVRDVIADMEATTGARTWARILRSAAGAADPDDTSTHRRTVGDALTRARCAITAVCDFARQDEEDPGAYSDGYRQALAELRVILTAFGHLDDNRADGAELAHHCTNPQVKAFVEVDDLPIPVAHARPPKEDGSR